MPIRLIAAVLLGLVLVACAPPRPAALQGDVCKSMATLGQLPVPWPDITPSELRAEAEREERARTLAGPNPPPVQVLPDIKSRAFRAKIAAQAAIKRSLLGAEPTSILTVSAGGTWGAFSIGFLDGWGERRPRFDVVTGVSTGAMIAPAIFLGDPVLIAEVRRLYGGLKESDLYTPRSLIGVLAGTSLFDTTPLRGHVEKLLTESMVVALAAENAHRTLAVMATNLDSGVPEVFDLTAIAADTNSPLAERRGRIIAAVMAASALPIAFPPEFIDQNMYVDGGVRLHVFFANEFKAAYAAPQVPVDITVVVSGDMAVTRDCTGLKSMGILSVAGRTASAAIDQLLRGSVQALLTYGMKPGNQARMINARRLVDYGAQDPPTPPGRCKLSDQPFDPVFEGCLVQDGAAMGQAQPIQWNIEVAGPTRGRPPRISALP
jgi:predicted acylesterase/phospholipase RssA